MSLLATAITVQQQEGMKAIIYGAEGSGKSSLLGSLDDTLFIALEKGYTSLNLNNNTIVPINDYPSLIDLFAEVSELNPIPFKNIVIDSLSALERYLSEYIIAQDPKLVGKVNASLSNCHGGYGIGVTLVNKEFLTILSWLDSFAAQGVNILCTAHSFLGTEIDTEYGTQFPYQEILLFSPKNSKSYGIKELAVQFCDLLGYLHHRRLDDGSVEVVLNCNNHSTRHRSKNRFNITKEIVIPLENGFNSVNEAIFLASGKNYL